MPDQEEFDFGDNVDVAIFEQILEMDDEDDPDNPHEFSQSIVFGYLEQAQSTFEKMDAALKKKDLDELSALGHFLKGSSATLGFTKVKDECEKIQHYGHQKDETGTVDEPDKKVCLDKTSASISQAKNDFKVVERLMQEYYRQLNA